MTGPVLLTLSGVAMQHGSGETAVTALSGIDLTVREGELVAARAPWVMRVAGE